MSQPGQAGYYSPMPETHGLVDAFWAASRGMRRGYVEALHPLGLTPHQARALVMVAADGPLRLGELAAGLRIAPRSATDVVDGLEEQGHVARERDPSDRRAVVVAATPQGRALVGRIESARREHAAAYFSRLSADDQAELARLLRLLVGR